MLRKTPISPYIWWFWGAFGSSGGLLSVLAAVWTGMAIYGGIWYAMVIYMVALYIYAPNQCDLLHLLLIASVHIVCIYCAKG